MRKLVILGAKGNSQEIKDIFEAAREVVSDDSDGSIAAKFRNRKEVERKLFDEKAEVSLEE